MVERNTFQTEDTWAEHPELRRNRLEGIWGTARNSGHMEGTRNFVRGTGKRLI